LRQVVTILAFVYCIPLLASAAHAQFGGQPGGMPPGGMGPQPMGEEPKEEGPAEEAPEQETQEPSDLEPLGGYPGQSRRVRQVVQLNGYLRFRTDFFHKLHLDQTYFVATGDNRTPPFPLPLECPADQNRCNSKNLGGGNLRLRLDPTVNITDEVRVNAQVDVFDNLLMGSTPDSLINARRPGDRTGRAGVGSLSSSQDPPEIGFNSLVTSIRAKRAWGEVDSQFGKLQFGRMPWHFGRGIAYNSGNCPDCDGGTTVDRVLGLTQVYGHQIALSWDFGAQGHHVGLIDLGLRDPNGPPLDLSQRDDVLQLMLAITHLDDERRFAERALQGELMFNYGTQIVVRKQGHELYDFAQTVADPVRTGATPPSREDLTASLNTNVNALVVLPSLWMKLAWKALTVEAEASGVLGKIGDGGPLVDPAESNKRLTLQQMGWVVATELRLYKNAFFLGFETGGATGDQAENPSTYLNYRWKLVPQPPGDHVLADFKFSPDYHVDEILFRRILGTVTNAVYVKPQMTYWLDLAERRQVGLSAAFIYSMAMESVSTPGNTYPYGVEMNLGLNYRNPSDGFYGGVTWAVLWPLSALNRPDTVSAGGFRSLWPEKQDATSAQALRAFLGIRF
jgi:uncharacterized protein (TIGR04551 family)